MAKKCMDVRIEMVSRLWKGATAAGIFFLALVVFSPCLYGLLLVSLELPGELNWRENTSPLPPQVVQDLCQKFQLGDKDPRCKPGVFVYAPEYFKTIRQDFIDSREEPVTYDYVQKKIGTYQNECGPFIQEPNGAEYFRCSYDFQGDGVYTIGIAFDSTGKLWRLYASTSD